MAIFNPTPRQPATPRQLWLGLLLMLAMSIAMPAIAWVQASADARLRADLIARGVRVPGTVTGFSTGKHGCGARFDFITRDGQPIHKCYGSGLPFPERAAITAGAPIDIVYDPASPTRAIPEPAPTIPQIDPRAWAVHMGGIGVLIFGTLATIILIRLAFMPASGGLRRAS